MMKNGKRNKGSVPVAGLLLAVCVTFYWTTLSDSRGAEADKADNVAAIKATPAPKAEPILETREQIQDKKKTFFRFISKPIAKANQKVLAERRRLLAMLPEGLDDNQGPILELVKDDAKAIPIKIARGDAVFLNDLSQKYKLEVSSPPVLADLLNLLHRVDVIPPSLAMAQAANESAWGKSRFATEGNNYFGQWCFSKGCGLVPAGRPEGARYEVREFDNPQASVESYVLNINRHNAYKGLREIRSRLRAKGETPNGHDLADGLLRYSERGEHYVEELRAMIRVNRLAENDKQLEADSIKVATYRLKQAKETKKPAAITEVAQAEQSEMEEAIPSASGKRDKAGSSTINTINTINTDQANKTPALY
jgi:Bax protein